MGIRCLAVAGALLAALIPFQAPGQDGKSDGKARAIHHVQCHLNSVP